MVTLAVKILALTLGAAWFGSCQMAAVYTGDAYPRTVVKVGVPPLPAYGGDASGGGVQARLLSPVAGYLELRALQGRTVVESQGFAVPANAAQVNASLKLKPGETYTFAAAYYSAPKGALWYQASGSARVGSGQLNLTLLPAPGIVAGTLSAAAYSFNVPAGPGAAAFQFSVQGLKTVTLPPDDGYLTYYVQLSDGRAAPIRFDANGNRVVSSLDVGDTAKPLYLTVFNSYTKPFGPLRLVFY